MSFSATLVQMGRRCLRQKSLLQVVHVEVEESAMMVLLLAHVHLQNEGGAGGCVRWGNLGNWGWETYKLRELR